MKIKYLIFLFIIFIFNNCSEKIDERKINITQDNRILAFGDSLTFGYQVEKQNSYPSILSNKINLNIDNKGISGELSNKGLKRLKKILNNEKYDVLLLIHGGNDILQNKSMRELKSNLNQMIKIATNKNLKIIMVSVPHKTMFGIEDLAIYKEIANENKNVILIENILTKILENNDLKVDYIHPNKLGYIKLSDEIYKHLNLK